MAQLRPLAGFQNQTDQQVLVAAQAVLKGMTGNPAYPNPSVDLKDLTGTADSFAAALAAQAAPS